MGYSSLGMMGVGGCTGLCWGEVRLELLSWEISVKAMRKSAALTHRLEMRWCHDSCVTDELGAPLAVIDALADAYHAAGGNIVGRGSLLHSGAPHAPEHLDRRDRLSDVHGVP